VNFEMDTEIDPSHPALPAHFPGNPVVPAVKFLLPLLPGERFRIVLQPTGATALRFTVTRGGQGIARGTAEYSRGAAAG
jgi:3-hydroxymyristoyl/3-hydroxydecanoyl-(acyl carrier protein) dehydratase